MRPRAFSAVIVCLLLLPAIAVARVSASHSATHAGASLVVTTYFGILNGGMRSGDFSALSTVYAPDATLRQSSPKGVTKVLQGLKAIIGFYTALQKTIPGYQFTLDSTRPLDQWVVLAYEHAGSPPLSVPARCSHLFVVVDGKIRSLDWVAFFPGKQ